MSKQMIMTIADEFKKGVAVQEFDVFKVWLIRKYPKYLKDMVTIWHSVTV